MDNEMKRYFDPHRDARGFSLVEAMVALVIGLIATIVIMQMYQISEGRKRTSTGGGDAQTNAGIALYQLERDLRQAGYGLAPNTEDFVPQFTAPANGGVLTTGILAQCANVRAYNKKRAIPDFVYAQDTFAPVVINPPGYPAGDGNTDVILVNFFGSSGIMGNGIPITQSGASTQPGGNVPDYIAVTSRAGFNQGDMILAVPPPAVAPAVGLDCTIGEVTGLPVAAPPAFSQCAPGITGVPNEINHNDMTYLSWYAGSGCGNQEAVWNKPGVGVGYAAGSRLYNLGPVGSFVSRVYAVRKGNLTMCDLTVNDCTAAVSDPPDGKVWTPIGAGVQVLKAQYGKDTDFNGTIETWNTTQPKGLERATVVAVRMALLVRSNQYEKEAVTSVIPEWQKDASGTSNAILYGSSFGADWQHYRYKVVQSIVPLRNMIWGGQMQ